jgi:pyroglutamyl-peptidase
MRRSRRGASRRSAAPSRELACAASPQSSKSSSMASVLITAFEPYDRWTTNASWLSLVEFARDLPAQPAVTTRLYPVDFAIMKQRLAQDLEANFDYAIHLGQAPGIGRIHLEAVGLNVGGSKGENPDLFAPLVHDGPVAYRSTLPLAAMSAKLRRAGIPAQLSYHAGTYLCNATLYYSCYLAERLGLDTQAAFVHLPLDLSQTIEFAENLPALPAAISAAALRLIVEELADERI